MNVAVVLGIFRWRMTMSKENYELCYKPLRKAIIKADDYISTLRCEIAQLKQEQKELSDMHKRVVKELVAAFPFHDGTIDEGYVSLEEFVSPTVYWWITNLDIEEDCDE